MDQIISSFKIKKELSSTIWNLDSDNISLITEIRTSLLKIAQTFIATLKIPDLEVEDILFLGSLAGYNWSKFADIDLHILIDKSKLEGSDEIVDEYFDAKKKIFNESHDITIKGFEVELYVQDIKEKNESNGVYSILYKNWIKEPSKEEDEITVDKKSIIKKVKDFNREFNLLKTMTDSDKKIEKLTILQDKIKKYRKSGLDNNGEMSTENLVFKYLRRSGYMEDLIDLKIEITDNLLTLKEVKNFN